MVAETKVGKGFRKLRCWTTFSEPPTRDLFNSAWLEAETGIFGLIGLMVHSLLRQSQYGMSKWNSNIILLNVCSQCNSQNSQRGRELSWDARWADTKYQASKNDYLKREDKFGRAVPKRVVNLKRRSVVAVQLYRPPTSRCWHNSRFQMTPRARLPATWLLVP